MTLGVVDSLCGASGASSVDGALLVQLAGLKLACSLVTGTVVVQLAIVIVFLVDLLVLKDILRVSERFSCIVKWLGPGHLAGGVVGGAERYQYCSILMISGLSGRMTYDFGYKRMTPRTSGGSKSTPGF